MTQTLPRRIPGASGHGATPLAVGDRLALGSGHAEWEVVELPASRHPGALVRLTSSGGAVRNISWLRISQGQARRCNGIPISEAQL